MRFKGAAKFLAAKTDPDKQTKMVEPEELCLAKPADLEVAIKGQRFKGDLPININDARWHHVALTWQSKGGELRVYVDGSARLEKSGVQQGAQLARGGCLVVGQSQGLIAQVAYARGFQGHVAQVGLWNKILPMPRIVRSMSAPLNGSEDGLVYILCMYVCVCVE